MFTGGTIWILTHGQMFFSRDPLSMGTIAPWEGGKNRLRRCSIDQSLRSWLAFSDLQPFFFGFPWDNGRRGFFFGGGNWLL